MDSNRVREFAEELMVNHAYDVEYMTISEAMGCEEDLAVLGCPEFDSFQLAVDRAINSATVTVSWPEATD